MSNTALLLSPLSLSLCVFAGVAACEFLVHFPDDSNHPMPQQDCHRNEAQVKQGMIVAEIVSNRVTVGYELMFCLQSTVQTKHMVIRYMVIGFMVKSDI